MKFLTYSTQDNERQLGILINDNVYAVKDLDNSLPNQMEEFLKDSNHNLAVLQAICNEQLPIMGCDLKDVTIHAPLQHPGSIRDFMAFENHLLNASKTSGI